MAKSKPVALPNISRQTIAQQAHRLFGAVAEVDRMTEQLALTRKAVAESGVDPGVLVDLLKVSREDPWSRLERDRTLAQYATALAVPGVAPEPDLIAALEDEPDETDEERDAREYGEGFWSYLTHKPARPGASQPFTIGYHDAMALVCEDDDA